MVKFLMTLILAHEIFEGEHHGLVQVVLILFSLTVSEPNMIGECKRHRPVDQEEEARGGEGEGFAPGHEHGARLRRVKNGYYIIKMNTKYAATTTFVSVCLIE
jgi:hypothetical protein